MEKFPSLAIYLNFSIIKKSIHHRCLITIYIVLRPYNNIPDFWKKYMKDFPDFLHAVAHGFLLYHTNNIIIQLVSLEDRTPRNIKRWCKLWTSSLVLKVSQQKLLFQVPHQVCSLPTPFYLPSCSYFHFSPSLHTWNWMEDWALHRRSSRHTPQNPAMFTSSHGILILLNLA